MNSVTDYIDTIAFFAFCMYYCSYLYVLTHVTTHVTVCVICHAEIKGYLLTYLLTYLDEHKKITKLTKVAGNSAGVTNVLPK